MDRKFFVPKKHAWMIFLIIAIAIIFGSVAYFGVKNKQISGADEDEPFAIQFQPPKLKLPPGNSGTVTISVKNVGYATLRGDQWIVSIDNDEVVEITSSSHGNLENGQVIYILNSPDDTFKPGDQQSIFVVVTCKKIGQTRLVTQFLYQDVRMAESGMNIICDGPDLITKTFPQQQQGVQAPGSATITVETSNIGIAKAGDSTTRVIFGPYAEDLNDPNNLTSEIKDIDIPALDPGSKHTESISIPCPSLKNNRYPSYSLKIMVETRPDFNNKVVESDEMNGYSGATIVCIYKSQSPRPSGY